MPVYRINDVQFDTEKNTLTFVEGQKVRDPKQGRAARPLE